ncbi:MAG: energy transducer TonB [Blastocatellia bacterium]
MTPLDLVELLSSSGYEPTQIRAGLWEILELRYRPKNLKALNATLERSADNQTVRISVFIGVHNESADDEEFTSKLVDLNKRSKPTELILHKRRVFAVTDLLTEKIDKDTLVGAIEKTARDADSLYPEIAKYVKLLEPSLGPGMGTGRGGGIGYDPNAKVPDSPINSQTNVARSVDTKPVILVNVQPHYTEEARREKIQGVVTLRILVDETGSPTRISVIQGLPYGLSERAIEAARRIKFKPAMKDGKPVSFWIVLQMNFSIY